MPCSLNTKGGVRIDLHASLAFCSLMLRLLSVLCFLTKPLQLLNRIKRNSQRHIGPFDLWPTIYNDNTLYRPPANIYYLCCCCFLLLYLHRSTPQLFYSTGMSISQLGSYRKPFSEKWTLKFFTKMEKSMLHFSVLCVSCYRGQDKEAKL